jgi:hypothetical protein
MSSLLKKVVYSKWCDDPVGLNSGSLEIHRYCRLHGQAEINKRKQIVKPQIKVRHKGITITQ